MQLTKKIRIYPTEEQVDVLWELSEKCRIVYNFALADRKDTWTSDKRSVKYTEQQNKLPDFKKRNPEFKSVYSKTYQGILKKLEGSYNSFFGHIKNGNKKARPPNFKGRNYLMTIPYNQSGFIIFRGYISFSHSVNDTELIFDIGNLADGLKVKQAEIVNDNPYKARGKFYICLTYEIDVEDTYFDNGNYQAIDLGITKIVTAINSEGKFFEVKTPRPDNYWNQKIDTAKSRRDHCIGKKKGSTKSRRFLRIARTVTKMSRKKANQVKDFQHKLSRKMVENTKANTIIVGDLSVQQMAQPKVKDGKKEKKTKQKKGLNRSTQGLGNLGRFVQFLTYKAELIGKHVIRIDEKNTSKKCCYCGKKHNMPTYERVMSCDCGNNIDRDRNSSINIMVRYLSQNALWTGYQQFVDNLRQYRLPDGIEVFNTEAK
ncbi:transposase [Methanosarcina sp. Ant1]|nr:transposase [Methanosarcina sp. Ant1]